MEILLGIISGGAIAAILVFIQYLITRHDNKADKNDAVLQKLDELEDTMSGLKKVLDERDAITARRAILRFGDEVYNDKHHNKELFDQTLEDADRYEEYCKNHPEFKNSKTVMTMEFIKDIYNKLFVEHKFD